MIRIDCLAAALIAAALLSLPPSRAQSQAAAQTAPQPLFLALEVPENAAPALPPLVLRERTVAVRTELLQDAETRPGTRLELNLFEDASVLMSHVRTEPAWGGGWVWNGRLTDASRADRGTAAFSVLGEAVAASVRLDERLYRVDFAGAGAHRVRALDESAFPLCGNGNEHAVGSPPALGATGGSQIAAATNLPTIDILVVYTTLAKNGQGGTSAMQALVNLAVSETNQGYQNSDVVQRLRLVHQAELSGYNENGNFGTELDRLTNPGDGWIDNVHALRDQYGADEVSMIVNSTQYCGIAWLMINVSNSFKTSAFNVVSRTCATGYYSFGHELGHNMGSHHDIANAGPAAYPYSYGWRTANGLWRTILAYAPGTRIQYFSNPNKTYQGQFLGLANQAENWRSLNNTADTVAQWRCAKPASYGTGKTTSSGKLPYLAFSGTPIYTGLGNFQVRIQDAEPNKSAIVFYGFAPSSAPFYGGTLYVQPPLVRLPPQLTDATGMASFAFPIATFTYGDEVYVQGWFRDPSHPDGTTVGLTNGGRIDVCQYSQ